MDVELGWIVVEFLPSGDLAWRGGDEWVRADAPPIGWRGRRRRGARAGGVWVGWWGQFRGEWLGQLLGSVGVGFFEKS